MIWRDPLYPHPNNPLIVLYPQIIYGTFRLWTRVLTRVSYIHLAVGLTVKRDLINSAQTRCIVKGETQKSPLFWRFSGGFWFSQDRLFSRISTGKPLNLTKSLIDKNTPCKSACLYNAPSICTVDLRSLEARGEEVDSARCRRNSRYFACSPENVWVFSLNLPRDSALKW